MATKTVPYEIEGQGKTTAEAEKRLTESKKQLEARVKQSDLTPTKTVFLAQYALRSGVDISKAESTEFDVRYEDPKKGWTTVLTAATKRAKPLRLEDYSATFTVRAQYSITEEQAEASRKKDHPVANYEGRRSSSVDVLRRAY